MSAPRRVRLHRLERAHYRIAGCLYGCRTRVVEDGILVHSELVPEPDWNHLGRVDAPGADIDELIALATREASRAGREPTIAENVLSRPRDLGSAFEARGWVISFRHTWLLHEGPAPDAAAPADVLIRPVRDAEDLETFLDIFATVFTPDDARAAAAYRAALDASARHPGDEEAVHYLAFRGGAPAGTATAVYAGGVAGCFNLGVLTEHRGHGIGRALTLTRLAAALRAGNDLVYLLTEDPAVEAMQLALGHRRVMVTTGWSPAGAYS